jgi:hypothetical protein
LGSLITNVEICTREIKSRIAIGRNSIHQEEGFFHEQIGRKFKKAANEVLHLEHNFIYGAETGYFGK